MMVGDAVRVVPVEDAQPHVLESYGHYCPCPCGPRIALADDGVGVVVVHSSFDGREAVEWAERILGLDDESDEESRE